MYSANGVGLAATQVNVPKRVLVLDISETRDQPQVLINPEILSAEGKEPAEEGCLSVPGIYEKVSRASKVRVGFENPAGGLWRLFVEDDGMGLVNDGASAGSRGMANMRHRAVRMGAVLQLGPSNAGGLRVEVRRAVSPG